MDLLAYKAQMGEQVSQIQMQMNRERDQMSNQIDQNAELMTELQKLKSNRDVLSSSK